MRGLVAALVSAAVIAVLAVGTPAPARAQAPLQDFSGLANRLLPAVVEVIAFGGARSAAGQGRSLGSGFVIDASGVIVTNNHVIDAAQSIVVRTHDGIQMEAALVGTDPSIDIAVLKVTPTAPMPFVPFGDSDSLSVGQWVLAIGNPFGLGGTVTLGIISARNRTLQGPYDDFIQTDAAINSGNSGGPLFNAAGQVIGVNTAIITPDGGARGIAFAVPSALAEVTARQLLEFGEGRRGWLGVGLQAVTEAVAREAGLSGRPRGALIMSVVPGGPAALAGIEPGDIILRYNNREVRQFRTLPRLVATTDIGTQVPLQVWRNGQRLSLTVTIGNLNERSAGAMTPEDFSRRLGEQFR